MELSRADLYERVWNAPLRELARELGISDVGLAKACRRHAIPTPPRGYWMRKEPGRIPERPALPPAPDGDNMTLSLVQSRAQRLPSAPGASVATVQIAADTARLAPFAHATFAALSKARASVDGLVSCGGAAHFQCAVSPSQAERACRILDAIERKLSELGGHVRRGTDKKHLHLDFSGQPLVFTLAERYSRTPCTPEIEGPSPIQKYTHHLTGQLRLTIDGYFEGRKSWSDGSRANLENKLPEVLAGLSAAAAAMKRIAEERAEQSRRREEEGRVRQVLEETMRRRSAFQEAFVTEAIRWQRHRVAAEYLAHLRENVARSPALPDLGTQWLRHATQAVADLDPTARRLQLLYEGMESGLYGPSPNRRLREPVGARLAVQPEQVSRAPRPPRGGCDVHFRSTCVCSR